MDRGLKTGIDRLQKSSSQRQLQILPDEMSWALQEALHRSTSTAVAMRLGHALPCLIEPVHYKTGRTDNNRSLGILEKAHHIHPDPYTGWVRQ